ncbi:PREDICTED: uncharacterized protein LOC109126273 [Camelina sativa]|uniref:Uncharacterized protein LOC109126273 n=1 Tax=Camelina sativa TaxID=90675 RepID=A0ABM1QEB3_CAMSA|nr:PREDICTED: uncharacterized protein LOC109126273 [Camelina sativa]
MMSQLFMELLKVHCGSYDSDTLTTRLLEIYVALWVMSLLMSAVEVMGFLVDFFSGLFWLGRIN